MNQVSGPTDNLYKFLALSGLALIVACILGLVGDARDLTDRSQRLNEELAVLLVEAQELDANTKQMTERLTVLEGDVRLAETSKSRTAGYKLGAKLKEHRVTVTALSAKSWALRRKNAAIEAKQRTIALVSADQKYLAGWRGGLIAIGICLAYGGFHYWYYRLQIYEDMKVRNEALAEPKPSED